MADSATELRRTVDDATRRLSPLTEQVVARRPAPGKWSPKEILGHLVDSAANNHARFVLAQGRGDLDFPGYEQERWVSSQRYQDEPWDDVLALWIAYNRHIGHVADVIPPSEMVVPRARHSLARIAWQQVDPREPATLEFLIADYVAHLRHHLSQIYSLTGA
jgi:hypothetical protein